MTSDAETGRRVRIGLAGYGFGGRYFHAPLLASSDLIDFTGVVTTAPARRQQVADEHGVRVVFVTANPSQIGHAPDALGYVRKPFCEGAILAAARLAEGATPANDDLRQIRRDAV